MSEQRLIDANALMQEINGYFRPIDESQPMTLTVGQIEEVLDIMQTIEAVTMVRGKWTRVRKWWQGGSLWVMCSECEKLNASTTNFCPHCGCDMRGDTP